jgi:two-component system copper resistance phosphate regulon response regulator CusR
MKILLIEDEKKTAAFLKKGLMENGFTVDIAENGEDGLHLARESDYDLIIIDVMLPIKDGWTVMTELRQSGKQTLSLFLTAKDTTADKVKGLDLGADAYLVKPFAFSELMAHVRSLLRRGPSRPSLDELKVADLHVDLVHRKVTRGVERLDLTPKEFSLLALLMRRQGEIISRAIISEHVWDMSFDSETNVVDVHIRRLRAKVDDPFPKKLIHTVRGMGYVLKDEESGT